MDIPYWGAVHIKKLAVARCFVHLKRDCICIPNIKYEIEISTSNKGVIYNRIFCIF